MAAQQQQQGGDNSLAPLWITAGIFIFGWVFWIYAHAYIVSFVLKLKLAEASFIALFSNSANHIINGIKAIPEHSYAELPFPTLVSVSDSVGQLYQYPVAIILLILGILVYFSQPAVKYRRTHSMKSLVLEESKNWPQISPVKKIDLVKTKLTEGPWAMTATPLEFARYHNLVIQERIIPSDAMLSNRAQIILSLKKSEAERIFAIQMGRLWINPDQLNIQTQALFAAFAARTAGDREACDAMLTQISQSAGSGRLDFSGVKELLKKYRDHKKVLKVRQSHAYILTVMPSMLKLAREDGVLASADFLWLKTIDRPLWYILNSVGRQTACVEVAGPFAHWLAEIELGHKIYVPTVKKAVIALEIALKEMLYKDEEE